MNILIIDNSVAFTGAFKCALNEAELLSDKHKFIFVINHKSTLRKTLEQKGFKVYQLPMVEIKKSLSILLLYPIMLLRNAINLLQILNKEHIDVVQVNDFYNLLGASVKKLGYKGKLITYVRFLPSVMPGVLRKMWIKAGVKHSHRVVAVSDAVLNQLPQNNTTRIYDPVRLSEDQPEKTYEEKPTVDILYLSNYIRGKGQEHALEAFAQAYKKNNKLRLSFMGGDMGLEKNADFKEELEAKAKELNLEDVVTFGPFSADVESVIKEADMVLNFSEAESFSMTCLEAAFYGTPLIATKCGGPEEIIDDGKTGLLVSKANVQEMSAAILKMADKLDYRKQLAIAGKAYVRQKFNIDNFTTSFQELLNNN